MRAILTIGWIVFAAATAPARAQETLSPASFRAFEREAADVRLSDFSGLPVPRYSSLRHDEVNGRAGPGTEFPVLWTYRRLGLPVIVVRESREWRKIRDPEGDEAWVHRRLLGGERTVMTQARGVLRRSPEPESPVTASFGLGVVLSLEEERGEWRKVSSGEHEGWAPASALWGVEEMPTAAGP